MSDFEIDVIITLGGFMKRFLMVLTILSILYGGLFAGGGAQPQGASTAGGAAKVYELKIGHALAPENPRHISLLWFKDEVEKKTNGGIKVTLYPSSQLGTEKEMLEQVSSGVIQGFRGGQTDFLPKMLIFSLPFLYDTSEQALVLLNSDFAKKITDDSRKTGTIILGIGDAGGFRNFTNNKRPIVQPSDFAGLKIRTNGLDTVDRTVKAFGASTVSIPFGDLYMALKTGVADGQENPWVQIENNKLYEVQKYITVVNYQIHPDPFYFNLNWYNGLPADFQKIIADAAKEGMYVMQRSIEENGAKALDIIKQNCEVTELTPAQREAFRQGSMAVYTQYLQEGKMTQAELDEMRRIMGK
jgi:C4-dicarboxylate-binding protein DctP